MSLASKQEFSEYEKKKESFTDNYYMRTPLNSNTFLESNFRSLKAAQEQEYE
jgi:hypothetical protein